MIAVLNEDGDYFSTHAFTRWKLAALAAGTAAALVLTVLAVTLLAGRADKTLRERELARKNTVLEKTFRGWEDRVRKLETEVKDVQRRNHQLRTTAFLSLPEVDYGIGGSESSLKSAGLFEFSEVRPIEWDLNRITVQIRALEINTSELEDVPLPLDPARARRVAVLVVRQTDRSLHRKDRGARRRRHLH
jgi:hypothetical protein